MLMYFGSGDNGQLDLIISTVDIAHLILIANGVKNTTKCNTFLTRAMCKRDLLIISAIGFHPTSRSKCYLTIDCTEFCSHAQPQY